NVWITADGVAKIGDFGLAVSLDRSRLTQEGMMVGTVSYMPPEQAMGGEVTPRSDLYSLGAMLYEMVTGRPPFLGDNSVAIIGQHINTQPVAPTWHNGQCPRALEALIMRLLAKDPSERPDSAADVVSALEAIDLTASGEEETAGVDDIHSLDSLAGGVFVGRQREMGELKAALEDTLSGRGRLVTLVGGPGIGKTRIALELATYAGLRQSQVLWGRCYEGEGAPPYWPWVQAIRSYVRDVDPEQLKSEMGAGAADIAEVVSDVREQLPGLGAPSQLEPEQARFRLFDSITAFLKSAGRRKPLVLVLDDLHWADHPSLLLLEFVARELANARVLIIGTYRDMELSRQHPLSRTLGELNRERLFQRVLLRGLDQDDVARFIELASGVSPPSGLAERVHRQTEGNPFFVTEVVRLLVQEGELSAHSESEPGNDRDTDSWNVRIPEGVREVIGLRLGHLSERCNQILTVASVLGREFTLEQLKPLIDDLTHDRLLEVLEEALGARVLEELPRVTGHYQFTHALIQDTLLEELSATRRVRLHARIAEVFEELYGDEVDAHAAALAYHLAAAGTLDSVPKMIYYSLKAGDRALATYAYEEALDHFERGLAAAQGQEMDSQTADLLLGLAKSKAATGQSVQMQDAWNSLSQAFDYYAEAGNVAQVSAIALYPFPLEVGILATGAVELIARALTIVPADSREAGHLQARYGNALGLLQGDYPGAQAAFKRSLETAQRLDDPSLEMGTLAAAAGVDWFHLQWREAMEKSAGAIELGKRLDEPVHQWVAHLWAVNSLTALGKTEEVQQRAAEIVPVAENLRHRSEVALAYALNARVSHLTGDFEAARTSSDHSLSLSPGHTQALVVRIIVEYESGNNTQGDEYLERLIESVRSTAPGPNLPRAYLAQVVPMVTRITGRTLGPENMDSETQGILSSASATPFAAMLARLGLATTAVTQDDEGIAAEQYPALTSLSGTALTISIDHLLGLLARTMGRTDDAKAHFEDALAFCQQAGYRPELAWTSFDYAETILIEADGDAPPQEGRDRATELLNDALSISRELGMRPLLERVLARRQFISA
ncbi:MAG: AAA family ATPase, partial [Chloroflexi bacterium]|nr:AAA family ATPase [Chloroflexota bacterium]